MIMVLMMMFLIILASSQGAPNQTGNLLPHPRYRREGTGSTPTAPEYIDCASLTSDKVFQTVFRTPAILKPFLNELLVGRLIPSKLDVIEVRSNEQQIIKDGEYNMLHDVRASDSDGNTYLIEMERDCGTWDVTRFQHVGYRVFSKIMESRIQELQTKARKDAEAKTMAEKKKAANAARAEAVAKNKNKEDVEADMKNAVKKVKKVNPKPLGHFQIYSHVPIVIVVIFAEKALPLKIFGRHFKTENQYILTVTQEEFGEEAKVHFVYIDLAKFGRTQMSSNPITPIDHWCSLIWNSKDGLIKKELYRKLENIEGISEVAKKIATVERDEALLEEAKRNEDENSRLRITMAMLREKVDLATIEKCTGYTLEELQRIKSGME